MNEMAPATEIAIEEPNAPARLEWLFFTFHRSSVEIPTAVASQSSQPLIGWSFPKQIAAMTGDVGIRT
jgi:hypothetical protein